MSELDPQEAEYVVRLFMFLLCLIGVSLLILLEDRPKA